MPETFYNRYNELRRLKEKYDSLKAGELCILYGRRRIGKTELVLKFLSSIPSKKVYLYVNKIAKKPLMDQFSIDIKNQVGDDLKISNWDSFFNYLIEESTKNKFILIIDEFQRLSEISLDFITSLQNYWDRKLKNQKIMIILLGSSMGMTHDLVFSSKGPLYGRSTLKLLIKPFRYVDFREMFSYLSTEEERIKYFSVFGGTAHYLTLVKNLKKPLFDTIKDLVLIDGSPLSDEPITLLSSELKSYTRHNSILRSIADGKTELPELAAPLELKQNQITAYLDHLINRLNLVKKIEPIFGKKKKTRYELSDNFFKFWYHFILTNKSTLELKNFDAIIKKIKDSFDQYVSYIVEEIIKELLMLYNGREIDKFKINFEEIGAWWEGGEEIDVVAYSKRELLLGEVKWRSQPINGLSILNELQQKQKKIEFNGRVKYVIFSKSGFTEDTRKELETQGVLCLDLTDLSRLFNDISKIEHTSQRTLEGFSS